MTTDDLHHTIARNDATNGNESEWFVCFLIAGWSISTFSIRYFSLLKSGNLHDSHLPDTLSREVTLVELL
jgi:hypothetical protein